MPGIELVAELVEALDRRRGGRDALPAERERLLPRGRPEDRGHLAARPVQVRLDDLEREPGRARGVERVAAPLEHRHPTAEASQCVDATIPNVPRSSGRVVKHHGSDSSGVVFARADLRDAVAQENPDGREVLQRLRRARCAEAGRGPRSGGSSPCCSSTSSASRRAPSGSTPRTCGRSSCRTTSASGRRSSASGGTVEKFIGDAVMGSSAPRRPTATTPSGPCAPRSPSATGPRDDGLQVRVAVNTGEAIVALDARRGTGEPLVAGDVVNTAARLQAGAPVGAVSSGEETYAATRDCRRVPARRAGRWRRGSRRRSGPGSQSSRLAGAGERPCAPRPDVGRERELATLAGIWERVTDERRPQLVTVFGPAGIGKSRLALEFAQTRRSAGSACIRGPLDAVRSRARRTARSASTSSRSPRSSTATGREARGEAARDRSSSSRGRAAAEEHAPPPRAAPRARRRAARSATARRCSSPPASSSRRSRPGADPAPLRGHPLGRREPARPLETLAARVRDVPVLLARPRPGRSSSPSGRAGAAASPPTRRCRSSRLGGGCEPRARRGAARPSRTTHDARRGGREDRRGQPALHRGARRRRSPSRRPTDG